MKLILLITALFTLLLSGCASAPQSVVIAPQIMAKTTQIYQGKIAQLHINDMRVSPHIVQIFSEDKAADLISSQARLSDIITPIVKQQFINNGLGIDQQANTTIEVIIEQAQINVQQELMKYQAKNVIELKIKISKASKTLTKSFKVTGKSNGPLRADIAVLERDFNQQLSKAIVKLVTDIEVVQMVNSL